MKFKHRFVIAGFLFSIIGLIVFGIVTHKQHNQLQKQQAIIDQLSEQHRSQQVLLATDTLLVEGHYQDALEQYENYKSVNIEDGQVGVGLRMAIAQKLLQFEDDLSRKALVISNEVDSVAIKEANLSERHRLDQLDSLNFVLSKTKVQLTKVRRQLQHKSFGEYLTFTNSKGSQVHYVGQVNDGKANGYGVAILNTGSRYVGEWKDNKRQGQGTFYWKDGEYYEGDYKADQRNGQGTYYWPNGEKYVGQWKDDKRSGKGAFFAKDGKLMTKGIWEEDKMITDTTKPKKKSKQKEMASL